MLGSENKAHLGGCGELDKILVLDNHIDEMALFLFWIIELMKNWIKLFNFSLYPRLVILLF